MVRSEVEEWLCSIGLQHLFAYFEGILVHSFILVAISFHTPAVCFLQNFSYAPKKVVRINSQFKHGTSLIVSMQQISSPNSFSNVEEKRAAIV
jgi:hypothetical protein